MYEIRSAAGASQSAMTLSEAERVYFNECESAGFVLLIRHAPGEIAEIIRKSW